MRYNLHFRIFHPKKVLGPPYGFSIFNRLYLGSKIFPRANFGGIRLSSTSSFK
ncbi:unnamed protein product [Meloidogyne enterolobii]|uniref:Uncharacterized protein n=1 Tax=Meloidogyne enterolobii TaxID=390850 RepID=A0ACB0YGV3_MELEN